MPLDNEGAAPPPEFENAARAEHLSEADALKHRHLSDEDAEPVRRVNSFPTDAEHNLGHAFQQKFTQDPEPV